MPERSQPSLFATDITCDSPAFAEILRWKFEEPFVRRLLIDDIPQRTLFGGCRMICYSNSEREIVGFGTIQRSDEFAALTEGRDHPYIPLLGVDPAKRGKGYGRQIVEHLILLAWHMAREKGGNCHDVLFLEVYETSAAAIRLYQKCGFQKAIDEPIFDPDENKRYFVMSKRVSVAPPVPPP
jgi:ribosomal protein S18 acetylase RimI-like enzyme